MRVLLLVSAAGLVLGGQELSTDYGRIRTLRTTSELELDLEAASMEMQIDGQPAEDSGRGGSSASLMRKSVVVDQILAGTAAQATHLRRSFEVLHDESTASFGGEERSNESDYPLAGTTLELVLDEEGAAQSELVEGPQPDDAGLLEGHEPVLSLDALLPDGMAELAASWELDHDAVMRALGTLMDSKLFPDSPPEERGRGEGRERGGGRGEGRGGRGGSSRTLGLMEWEGTAKLVSLDTDVDGVVCATIQLELEGRGDLPERGGGGGRGRGFAFGLPERSGSLEGTVEATLRGELLFAPNEGRPLSLELDGQISMENRFEREREGRLFSGRSEQSGRLTLTVHVEELAQ